MKETNNSHVGAVKLRYKPCKIFSDHQLPHVVWFEDALFYYGVPTVLFVLYILVQDIDLASDILAKAGCTLMQGEHRIGNARVDPINFPQWQLISPDGKNKISLLHAARWKFCLTRDTPLELVPLEGSSSQKVPFPPLAAFLDALIESWLDCPSENAVLLMTLAYQISYLYSYGPALKERSFAERMKYGHRQFHFDVLTGMEIGSLKFPKHQRSIRDALIQGQYVLQECSVFLNS